MHGNANILIVDDDPGVARSLELVLSRKGCRTDRACTGEEAIEKARAKFRNLVLLDIRLPDMPGMDLLPLLKSLNTDTRVIMITGYASMDTAISALNEGASAYITKPLDLDKVLTEITRTLEEQRLVLDNRRLYEEVKLALAESRRAENALLMSEAKIRALIETTADLVWETDKSGIFNYVSPQVRRVLGYEPAEIIGKSPLDLLSPEEAARIGDAIRSVIASCSHFSCLEGACLHNDGHLIVLETSGCPFFDDDGLFCGYRGISRDVTERKTLQRQLGQAQRLESIGQLAAGIAHEINTPVQYVGDNISFIKEACEDVVGLLGDFERLLEANVKGEVTPDMISDMSAALERADIGYLKQEIPAAAAQALDGVSRISDIVRAMRQFAHPGTKEKVPTDINEMIQNTIIVSRNEWKYIAEMRARLDPDLPAIEVLQGELSQVILNMVVNAAHAIAEVIPDGSDEKGTISIETRHGGGSLEIVIGDTGTGIPEGIRDRIFDPFFTTKGIGKGTGQGLAIAHSVIVERHGGRIEIESKLGEGTKFTIYLPLDSPTGD
ncbi:MAG: response regulator [Candidatus Coatesbacteria bacterium]|nr:response regulator [Candidatus Coatesbacteria bacterium]